MAPGRLKVTNIAAANTGTLVSWSLGMTPQIATPPQPAQAEGALFVRNTTSGNGLWYVQPSSPSNVPIWFNNGQALGTATDIPLQGDFDGDGKIDLATYNQTTAVWTISQSTRGGVSFTFGTPKSATYAGSMPVVGNFNGPGASEIGIFDIVTTTSGQVGQWTITSLTTGAQKPIQFGLPGDIPAVGDYDSVGHDELAVYRPSTAQFIVYEGAGKPTEIITIPGVVPSCRISSPSPAQYGNKYDFANDLPYKTEAAVFDSTTATFTIAGPTGNEIVTFKPGDIPAPADYLGDGEIQPAVYRPSTGQFLEKDPGSTGTKEIVIATFFPNLASATVVPVSAPLSYRIPASAPLTTPPVTTPPVTTPPVTTPPVTTPPVTTPPVTTPPVTTPPVTGAVTPTLSFKPGSAVAVNGSLYANGRQPWFVGTAAPGTTVNLVLSGTQVIGAKIIGTVVADSSGNFAFHLPAGVKNGTYVLVARAHGSAGAPDQVSTPLAFKVGPVPHVKVTKHPTKAPKAPKAKAPKKSVHVQPVVHPHVVVAKASANAHVVDHAVHALAHNQPLFKKKGH